MPHDTGPQRLRWWQGQAFAIVTGSATVLGFVVSIVSLFHLDVPLIRWLAGVDISSFERGIVTAVAIIIFLVGLVAFCAFHGVGVVSCWALQEHFFPHPDPVEHERRIEQLRLLLYGDRHNRGKDRR